MIQVEEDGSPKPERLLPDCDVAKCGRGNSHFVTIVHISDTHDLHENVIVPRGDVLVHTGDFFNRFYSVDPLFKGKFHEASEWWGRMRRPVAEGGGGFAETVYVAGNNEIAFNDLKPEQIRQLLPNLQHYLQDSGASLLGGLLRVYGSPWTSSRRMGFSDHDLNRHWEQIPSDGFDILATHHPPFRVLDLALGHVREQKLCKHCQVNHGPYKHYGCPDLFNHIAKRANILLHLFGHIHDGNGFQTIELGKGSSQRTVLFSNGAWKLSPRPKVIRWYYD